MPRPSCLTYPQAETLDGRPIYIRRALTIVEISGGQLVELGLYDPTDAQAAALCPCCLRAHWPDQLVPPARFEPLGADYEILWCFEAEVMFGRRVQPSARAA